MSVWFSLIKAKLFVLAFAFVLFDNEQHFYYNLIIPIDMIVLFYICFNNIQLYTFYFEYVLFAKPIQTLKAFKAYIALSGYMKHSKYY